MATATRPCTTKTIGRVLFLAMACSALFAVTAIVSCSSGPLASEAGPARSMAATSNLVPAGLPVTHLQAVSLNLFNRPWERDARLRNTAAMLLAMRPDILFLQE